MLVCLAVPVPATLLTMPTHVPTLLFPAFLHLVMLTHQLGPSQNSTMCLVGPSQTAVPLLDALHTGCGPDALVMSPQRTHGCSGAAMDVAAA